MEIYNKNKITVQNILKKVIHSLNEDQDVLNNEVYETQKIVVGRKYYLVGVNGNYKIMLNTNETDEVHGMSELYNSHIAKRDSLFKECLLMYDITITPSQITDVFSFGVYKWNISYNNASLIEEKE